jgi:hypothetical protein
MSRKSYAPFSYFHVNPVQLSFFFTVNPVQLLDMPNAAKQKINQGMRLND